MNRSEVLLLIAMMLVAITIPLKHSYNSWSIILFCIAALNSGIREGNLAQRLKSSKYWLVSVAFFGWMAISFLWETDGGFNIKLLERYFSFLFIPFLFTLMARPRQKHVVLTCYAFVASIIVVSLICLIKAYSEYQATHNTDVFHYHKLGYQMGLNAIFLSNYCVAGITWLLYFHFFLKDNNDLRIPVHLVVGICLFLAGMVFLLSSRLIVPIMLLNIAVLILYEGFIKKRFMKNLLVVAALGVVAAFSIVSLPHFQMRWKQARITFNEDSQNRNDAFFARKTMWTSAIELIEECPLLGYGLKGGDTELYKLYIEKGFPEWANAKLNSHNQFLQTWLVAGIPGLLLLLVMLGIPLIASIRSKHLLLLLLIIHYICQSMVEATLTVQQELVFFWFFIFLFYHTRPALTQEPSAI